MSVVLLMKTVLAIRIPWIKPCHRQKFSKVRSPMSQGKTCNPVMVSVLIVCAACNNVSTKTPVEESDDIVVKDSDG